MACGGIDRGDFLDVAEALEKGVEAQREAILGCPALEEAAQDQGQHAVEGVDADLGVSPVKHGFPTEEAGVFHGGKGILDPGLAAVSEHNLLVAPSVLVREEDALAELSLPDAGISGSVGAVEELPMAALLGHGDVQDFSDVLTRTNLADVLV